MLKSNLLLNFNLNFNLKKINYNLLLSIIKYKSGLTNFLYYKSYKKNHIFFICDFSC